MMDLLSTEEENMAWASLNTDMTRENLIDFCSDIERLFRINPYLEFIKWQSNNASNADIHIRNISNDEPVELEANITIKHEIRVEVQKDVEELLDEEDLF